MQINIKTSGENQAIVTQLTKKLTGGTKENVIARIALGYSFIRGNTKSKTSNPYNIDIQ